MRSILTAAGLALALGLVAAPSSAALPPGISGAWYNPVQSGHGLTIEILDADRALAFWHVFDPDGNPVHLYIEGAHRDGNALRGPAFLGSGMRFGDFDPDDHALEHWGQVTIHFDSCNSAELEWLASGPAGSGFGNGSMPLSRLSSIAGLPCGGPLPRPGLYSMSVPGLGAAPGEAATLLLADDGAAWLLGTDAAHSPSFVYTGTLSAGTLSLTGAPEPAIVYPQDSHPLLGHDLSALALEPGARPGTWEATVPGGAGRTVIAPLVVHGGPHSRYAVYDRSLEQQELAGRYWYTHGFLGAIHRDLTLEPDGRFTATDHRVTTLVCRYQGALSLLPGTASFEVSFEATDCGERDGSYSGMGYIADTVDEHYGPLRVLQFAGVARDADGSPAAFQFRGMRTEDASGGEGE